jgi:phage host-nuclease inhibitor protein Gam
MNAITGRTKRKAETAQAPRDLDDANTFLARIGELNRLVLLHQGALAESIAKAKEANDKIVADLEAEADKLGRGLQLWAEANRQTLTDNGKTKTVKLGTGTIAWRLAPPSVRIKQAEAVLQFLIDNDKAEFIRTKREIDRAAMLGMPEEAAKIPGVKIASAGEEFVIEPAGKKEIGA